MRKTNNLRMGAIERINLYAGLEKEVIAKRNSLLRNGTPEKDIIGLDYPEPMLIIALDEPIFNKFEFINALKIFISGHISDEELCMGEKKGWRYGKFYCRVNDNKIYCDADVSPDTPENCEKMRAEMFCYPDDSLFFEFSFCDKRKEITSISLKQKLGKDNIRTLFTKQNTERLSAEEIDATASVYI
ncbi:MAG: hypothetical protein LBR70_07365 [Lactobacillaceae bacterium]|nr:hypothetical protein [Lactobacillaceae bacterium]